LRILQGDVLRLAAEIRRAVDHNAAMERIARTADAWLIANIGQADDAARRAAIAILAQSVSLAALSLPADILALEAPMHDDIWRFLSGPHVYDHERFAKDLMLASGGAVPAGSFIVTLPGPCPGVFSPHVRRALGAVYRQCRQLGVEQALRWLLEAGVRPWAELHLDTRNLRAFSAEGFEASYRRLAGLMSARPELAGVFGASWLYDPQLKAVSPHLAFVRDGALAGGARLLRLPTDPAQVAFAVARSPVRRDLFDKGLYQPVCYGMYWDRRALIGWAAQKLITKQTAARRRKAPRSSMGPARGVSS
jgi:hypothetical protein